MGWTSCGPSQGGGHGAGRNEVRPNNFGPTGWVQYVRPNKLGRREAQASLAPGPQLWTVQQPRSAALPLRAGSLDPKSKPQGAPAPCWRRRRRLCAILARGQSGPRRENAMRSWIELVCLVVALAFAYPLPVQAQEYPNRAVKFVVPFPAGGPADTISRILTEKMAVTLGQTIVIENRAGAGGLTGIASVAKSDPDGYTIAIAPSSGLAMNVNLRENMPFHPLKDLALITQIVSVPEILVVNENVPARSLAELVVLAKSQPG